MPERTLKSGITVKIRLTPPHALAQVGNQLVRPIPPKVAVKSVAGHSELVTAPDDSPEWQEFIKAEGEYKVRLLEEKNNFVYDYSIEAWRDGAGEWQTEPPDDWEIPKVFEKYGIKSTGSRRLDYINYFLISTNDDLGIILDTTLGTTKPVTDQEVDAALGGFPTDPKRRGDSRRTAKRH